MALDNNLVNTENLVYYDIKKAFERNLIIHFRRLCFSKFVYEGLPEGVTSFYIERGLFNNGIIGITKNKNSVDEKYYALPLTGENRINFNGEIVVSNLTGWNTGGSVLFYNVEDNESGIFIKNTMENNTTLELLMPYINKLVNIWYSDNNNLLLSNKKLVAYGKPEHFNSIIHEQTHKLSTSPFIIIDRDRFGYEKWEDKDINSEILDHGINYDPLKYSNHFKEIYAQALNVIGILHNASNKAERNVSDEVNLGTIETQLINEEMLYFRMDAVERLNALYGLNVTVKLKVDKEEKEVKEDEDDGDGMEGDNNE